MGVRKYLILVVDDNLQNLQVISNILGQKGYDIGVATSGEDAMVFVRERLPDLVLLDVMMPQMSGFEVCDMLKREQLTRFIPVIFLSAKTDTESIVQGFRLGAVDYVNKPFIAEELLARVSTHLEMNRLRSMLPMCSKCRKIRNDDGLWTEIEEYIENHSDIRFSHGLCESCFESLYSGCDWYQRKKRKDQEASR
ncbi:MAG: response regulator [Deltaproteobacteria bacterium]|nr:response regulator [Deltaproteobacteria bacterium]